MRTTYKNDPKAFKKLRNQMLIRTIPLAVLAASVGLLMSEMQNRNADVDVNVLPMVIPIVLFALGYGMFKAMKRQKAMFESYELEITEDAIVRRQDLLAEMVIGLNEITEISKHHNGSFSIKGKDPRSIILIPANIEGYEELEAKLFQLGEVRTLEKANTLKLNSWVFGLGGIALFATVVISTNRIVVAVCGSAIIVMLIGSFIITQRNKNIDSKTKRASWLIFFVLFSVLSIMFQKLFGDAIQMM